MKGKPQKPERLNTPQNREAMKENQSSSPKSNITTMTTTMTTEDYETKDSCYFPGCRKDANCNCEICLASINSMLDLMPLSIQKSSLSKLSYASRPKSCVETTPTSFNRTVISTPTLGSCSISKSPPKKSMFESEIIETEEKKKRKKKKKETVSGICFLLKACLVLGLILCLESGFSWLVNVAMRPELKEEIVKNAGEKSWAVRDLTGRLRFLEDELNAVVNGRISNCSHTDSKWEINQDGLLFNSRCVLYKSATEEVSIWGWPLQTAGLLRIGFSSSSFTILSGRVTEWPNGKTGFLIRKANTSWVQTKWSGSVVQLDPNTWVLEYSRSSVLDSSSLFSMTTELLKHRISQAVMKMNKEFFCLSSGSGNVYSRLASKTHNNIPT